MAGTATELEAPDFDPDRNPDFAPGIQGRVRVAPDIPGHLMRRTVEVSGKRPEHLTEGSAANYERHPPELRPAGFSPTVGGAGPRRRVCRPRPTLRHRTVARANPLRAAAHGHSGKPDPDLPSSVDPHAVGADGHCPATADRTSACCLTRAIAVPDELGLRVSVSVRNRQPIHGPARPALPGPAPACSGCRNESPSAAALVHGPGIPLAKTISGCRWQPLITDGQFPLRARCLTAASKELLDVFVAQVLDDRPLAGSLNHR